MSNAAGNCMIKAETALKNSKEYWSHTRAEKVVDYITAISSKIEEYSKMELIELYSILVSILPLKTSKIISIF